MADEHMDSKSVSGASSEDELMAMIHACTENYQDLATKRMDESEFMSLVSKNARERQKRSLRVTQRLTAAYIGQEKGAGVGGDASPEFFSCRQSESGDSESWSDVSDEDFYMSDSDSETEDILSGYV